MPTIKRKLVALLSGLAMALAMLPASAHGAGPAASNTAESSAGNEAQTSQSNRQKSSCSSDCGGNRAAQLSLQESTTTQKAESEAQAKQNAGAGQEVSNTAISVATNNAGTEQSNYQSRDGGGSAVGCGFGCEGGGQAQVSRQGSTTTQAAAANAEAEQDVGYADLPAHGANAESSAGNEAQTRQSNRQQQEGGSSSCFSGCAGNGESQLSFQESATTQKAESEAQATHSTTQLNQPMSVAWGGSITTDASNSAGDEVSSTATSVASNNVSTKQTNYQSQDGGGSAVSCDFGCAGSGQAQVSSQSSTTTQTAEAKAEVEQHVSPASSGSTPAGNAAAESSTTTQLIWQVQLSGCVAFCSGTEQSQTAEEQNSTAQALNGPADAGDAHSTEVAESDAQAERTLTQIQLGCVSYCFGTTTTAPAPTLAAYAQAVEEVVRVLSAIAVDVSKLNAAPAADHSTVEQLSYQSQRDTPGVTAQSQTASQVSTTVQEDASSLLGRLEKTLEISAAAKAQAVNQTEQGIWQLQIGCLMFCNQTELYQLAVQSDSTVQDVVTPAVSTAAPSSENSTTQLIWQAQIGCLFWCFDTNAQQTAPGRGTPAVREGDGAPAPPPVEPPARLPSAAPASLPAPKFPPDVNGELTYLTQLVQALFAPGSAAVATGPEQPQPAPAAASLGSSGGEGPLTSSAMGPALPPSPALARHERSVLIVSSATGGVPAHPAVAPLHRRAAGAIHGLALQRATLQLPVVAPRAAVPRSTVGVAIVTRVPAAAETGLGDTALSSRADATHGLPLATLLSGLALCGLCIFGIAVAAARRDPRASKPAAGG